MVILNGHLYSNATTQHARHRKCKDCLELPNTNVSIFTLKNVTWLSYLISFTVQYCPVLFSISFCLYRACFTHLISSNLSCNKYLYLWSYGQLVHFNKEVMQTYIVKESGSILNLSTVHLNGIWHLIWRYLSQPVLGGHLVLSGHYSIPRGRPLAGFSVYKWVIGSFLGR